MKAFLMCIVCFGAMLCLGDGHDLDRMMFVIGIAGFLCAMIRLMFVPSSPCDHDYNSSMGQDEKIGPMKCEICGHIKPWSDYDYGT